MPALTHAVGSAEGPASEGLQGRKPRSACRAPGMLGVAMGIAPSVGAWTVRALAMEAATSTRRMRLKRSRHGPDGARGLGSDEAGARRR